MRDGLSDKTSVGRFGSYRGRRAEATLLSTAVARFVTLHTRGERSIPLGGPELPTSYTLKSTEASWTGLRYVFEWDAGDGLRVEQRSTLPGMMLIPKGKTLRLRFAFGNAPARVRDVEKGREFSYFEQKNLGRVLLLLGGRMPALLIAQSPVKRWHVLTHEHLEMAFSRAGVKVMWVPLLNQKERPAPGKMKACLRMLERPPLHCREKFEVEGKWVNIRQEFSDERGRAAAVAPLPPLWALLGSKRRLLHLPKARHLLDTLIGPLEYVEGASWEGGIDSRWMDARFQPTREVQGRLPAPPDELSYAGDVTWNPESPMDALISLNTWAPLASTAPPGVWKRIERRLKVPTASEVRRDLLTADEPLLGRTYRKDRTIFDERGEVSYDTDWYSGKMLAGMYRALTCADDEIRKKAERLVRGAKTERRDMQAYMEIYHDWALGTSWTDPRGEVWDLDCSHLGMGGVMAESKMRKWEGDAAGSECSRYLAAKMAVSFIAAYPLGDWCRRMGFLARDSGGTQLGPRAFRETKGAYLTSETVKSLGALPPDFPEFMWLLREYGSVGDWRRMTRTWERKYPQRYKDWLVFYTGMTTDKAGKSLRQEERQQAAVHYHLAPEIALRLLVLEEEPEKVEALYRRPPSLAETLWLRCAPRVVFP